MAVNFNPSVNKLNLSDLVERAQQKKVDGAKSFQDTAGDYLKDVNVKQADSNKAIVDLLTGKTQDINSVVAGVAKSDMSFKMLVGVRNKLVSAYKETMKMQI